MLGRVHGLLVVTMKIEEEGTVAAIDIHNKEAFLQYSLDADVLQPFVVSHMEDSGVEVEECAAVGRTAGRWGRKKRKTKGSRQSRQSRRSPLRGANGSRSASYGVARDDNEDAKCWQKVGRCADVCWICYATVSFISCFCDF